MRRPVTPPTGARGQGSQTRATPSRSITPANSNTRIVVGGHRAGTAPAMAKPVTLGNGNLGARQGVRGPASAQGQSTTSVNLGLNSERSRGMMVERLRRQGIQDDRVLDAMLAVPRHLFVDQGLASRAYEDAALPIGYGQTISQPWAVARMLSAVMQDRQPLRVLEVGAGCGYQAAVMAHLVKEVHAIERIRALADMAREHLRALRLNMRVRLSHGDGMLGLPGVAPFDAIVVAAAGIQVPDTLLHQLAPGARLIAPEGGASQRLVLIERTGPASWRREELETVRFVPLRPGTQL